MSGPPLWLTAAQFARLPPRLPTKPRGVPRVDDRGVLSGILPVLRTGLRGRAAPVCYGPSKPLSNRSGRWLSRGKSGASGAAKEALRTAILRFPRVPQPRRFRQRAGNRNSPAIPRG